MNRHCIAMAASVCALALAPSAALAGNGTGGPAGGLIKQTQTATNQNATEQSASSEANSKQTNINAPVSILSSGSNNGDVHQSNNANTSASSDNNNNTHQSNNQSQNANARRRQHGDEHGSCGCRRQQQPRSGWPGRRAEPVGVQQQRNRTAGQLAGLQRTDQHQRPRLDSELEDRTTVTCTSPTTPTPMRRSRTTTTPTRATTRARTQTPAQQRRRAPWPWPSLWLRPAGRRLR